MSFKNICYSLFIFILLSSCAFYKDLRRPEIVGFVFNNKAPLENVKIHFLLEEDQIGIINPKNLDSTKTNDKGYYSFKKIVEQDRGFIGGDRKGKFLAPSRFVVQKIGYKSDTINLRNYDTSKNIIVDTIFLIKK